MKIRELFTENYTPHWSKIFGIPLFNQMLTTEQNSEWHKEGNVAVHTQLVTEAMANYLDERAFNKESEYYLLMMAAAICHDIGKVTTTKFNEKINKYTCRNHAKEGGRLARLLFFDEDVELREKLCYMIRHHMDAFEIVKENKIFYNTIKSSMGIVPLRDMLILHYCDVISSKNDKEDENSVQDRINKIIATAKTIYCYDKPYMFDKRKHRNQCFYEPTGSVKVNKNANFQVYVMVGIAGAGKDTWIEKNIPDVKVLCRDHIRTEIGIEGDKPHGTKEQEDKVTEIINERIIECCEKQESFVLNNTNLKLQYRDELHKMIYKYNPEIIYVYIEAPSIEDNKKRRKGQIDSRTIERMAKSFDFPEFYEYDKLIIYKQINET